MHIWNTIQAVYGYTDLEIRRIQYTLKVIFSELSKIILLFFVFLFLHKAREYIIAVFVLCSLRRFSGGAHMSHHWSCLLCTFLVIYLSIYPADYVILPEIFPPAAVLLCCLVTYLIGPIPSRQRPPYSYTDWKNFRIKSVIVLLFYFLTTILFPLYPYLDIVVWTIMIQTLQLVITKIIQKGECYEKTHECKLDENRI